MRDELVKKNLAITISSLLVFFLLSLFITSYNSRQSLEEELVNLSRVVNNQLIQTETENEMNDVIYSFTNDQNWLRIAVANSRGYIVIDSTDDTVGSGSRDYFSEEELSYLSHPNLDSERIYIKNNVMYMITAINDDIIVRIGMQIQDNNSYILNSLFYMLCLVLLVLLISIFFTRKTSTLITDAFTNISSHLRTINDGEYQQIETEHKFPEVEDSLIEINGIYNNIYQYITEIKESKEKIDFVISNIQQGFIIIDESGHINIMNDYAKSILNIKDFESNISYNKVIKDNVLKSKIRESLKKKQDYYFDLSDDKSGRIYATNLNNLHTTWNKEKDIRLLVITLINVTEERTNDKMKADFISNASHELKTPITSISGFAEFMLNSDEQYDETTKKFLKIIYDEAIKMKLTINDLLYLSNLDHIKNQDKEDKIIYFKPLIEEVLDNYALLAEEDGITLHYEAEDLYINDSSHIVKHLISNLVENAIKYNRPNGRVDIKLYRKDNKIVLTVTDTGIGIDKKEYEKIFERFYRVDQSHNRNIKSGSGLGLNIVKQICTILNARIDIESEVNVGTTFIITFNKED